MKYFLHFYTVLFLLICELGSIPIPELSRRVTDSAHILSESSIQKIEAELKAHEEATSNQIAVLTVPSLEGESIEDYNKIQQILL